MEDKVLAISYDELTAKKGKIKKHKYQCNSCGYIDYLLNCPKCNGGMFRYKNPVGTLLREEKSTKP